MKWWSRSMMAAAYLGAFTLAAGTTVLAAAKPATPTAATTQVPKLSWKGTITFYAQSYTPAQPGKKYPKGSTQLHEFQILANQFEHLYPGIHIRFIRGNFQSTNQQVVTKAAAGTMYDIYWNQVLAFNTEFPKGIVYNLAPYFQKPNPYIPGNKRWIDVMNPNLTAVTRAADGQIYEVNGDYLGVEFFYNKTLFKKAGITGPPKTWAALMGDVKRLKAHGIIPGASIPTYDWWVWACLGNYLGLPTLKEISSFSKQPGVTEYDNAIAYAKGILNPAKNPRIMAWWPVAKQLYKYFDPNVTVIPWNAVPTGAATDQTLFAAGKVAMVFEGTWLPNTVKASNNGKTPFPIGSFPFPSLKGTSKYATSYNTAGDIGGPQAAYQFAISTPRADQSMSQPGKFQAVLDWLRFIATPQHDQAVVNELGSFAPTFKGTTPVPALKSVQSDFNRPWYQEDAGLFWTVAGYTTIRNIFQEYVSGHLSFQAARQQFDQVTAQAFHQYVIQHHLNLP